MMINTPAAATKAGMSARKKGRFKTEKVEKLPAKYREQYDRGWELQNAISNLADTRESFVECVRNQQIPHYLQNKRKVQFWKPSIEIVSEISNSTGLNHDQIINIAIELLQPIADMYAKQNRIIK